MKKPIFKVGDKVFAKVKGYPTWPACIIAENGKKYNVKFYGTDEIGIIKVEDIFYYLKNKQKFQKPLKRKDYVDAFEQIEKAIEEDGGDGDTSNDNSLVNESNVSLDTSNASTNTPKSGKKTTTKRKRSADKLPLETVPIKKVVRSSRSNEVGNSEEIVKPEQSPQKKSPKSKKGGVEEVENSEEKVAKEFEFVQIEAKKTDENNETNKIEDEKTEPIEEKTEALDFKVEIVSEKILRNNIAYAKHVKESESIFKDKPVEPREDYINQVLPIKLPSGIMGGIKLHTNWPLKFEHELERAIYDESVALRVIETEQKITSGDTSVTNNSELFIPNIEMTADDVKQSIYLKEIDSKKARINRLKIEADLATLDAKIKNCLGLDKANPKEALGYLEEMCKLDFDDIMLKKHSHVVEVVRRLRKYVGNTKEWNMSEESLNEFSSQAEKVREKAENVYSKFKEVVKLPDNSTSFWDGFSELVVRFRADCKDLNESQIYVLCAEPKSRKAFLDRIDEKESEKENVSGVANSEKETAVNGTAIETAAGES